MIFLKENVWGCRMPEEKEGKWIGCGKCSTCKELEVIGYINKFK